MLVGLPWIVAIGCGSFLVSGVYRGIWRYTGLAESLRFALAAMLAGLAVKLASHVSADYDVAIGAVIFVLLLFNFLVGTRWSFHLFQRIGRFLAHSARRLVIVGADARGAAAVQHLHSTEGASAELLGLLDDDSFKHGKLFHGYPVLGSLDDLDEIMARTPFDEIVIAQETLSACATGSARIIRAKPPDNPAPLRARRHRHNRSYNFRPPTQNRLSDSFP